MSPKLPQLSAREIVRIVEKQGFVFHHQTGSHAIYKHTDGRRACIPMHAARTLSVGLLRKILHEAGIDPDQFRV